MSGDGYYIANKSDINAAGNAPGLDPFWLPAGSGGGCVKSGPFVNYMVNLGPVGLALPGGEFAVNPHNETGIFSWNPRCLKRDLTDYVNQNFANASRVLDVVQLYDDVATFQLLFQGWPAALVEGGTTLGVHGGGNYASPAAYLAKLKLTDNSPQATSRWAETQAAICMSRPATLPSTCTTR